MKKKKFTVVVLSYILFWLIVTVVVCSILWSKLGKYEKNYIEAKNKSAPELFMPQALLSLSPDNIEELVREKNITVASRYESIEDYAEFFRTFVENSTLTWEKDSQRYSDLRPVYDIYAGGKLFAVISLISDGNVDDYGFNGWKVKDVVLSENNYDYHEVYLQVRDDMKVSVNGIESDPEDVIHTATYNNELSDTAYSLSGKEFSYRILYFGNMLNEPDIKVTDADGNDITDAYVTDDKGVRNYFTTSDADFETQVSDYIQKMCHTYIRHIYKKAYLYEILNYMVPGSEAETLMRKVQSALYYGWVPDDYEILSEDYSDYVIYSDKYFSCKSTINIKRWDDTRLDEEEFCCQWLFENVNGRWLVRKFVLITVH